VNWLLLSGNQLTGVSMLCSSCPVWYTSKPRTKRPSCCAGNISTEFGLCTALEVLSVRDNKLTGEHILAQIDRLVYDQVYQHLKRPSCCTGNIPTEFGLCTSLSDVQLHGSKLTGEHFNCRSDSDRAGALQHFDLA
jgi:hypothetical protein